jgi:site-specific recombinase XerC
MTVSPTREPVPEPADLPDAIAAFVTFGDVANHTPATHRTYVYVLERFRRTCGLQTVAEITPDVIQRHLMDLRARMRPISVHQSFRTLRTFCRWCERTGRMAADPMAGMTMRVPKILPSVPNDEDVRRLLAACANTPEGRRNRTVIALAADAGLRKEELRHLRVGDVDFTTRMIRVRGGKGQKDGVTFFGDTTASLLRTWLAAHPAPHPASLLLCKRDGASLGPYAIGLGRQLQSAPANLL